LRIVANVELVQIPVIVFDDKGAVAANLKKDDFRVLEDGVEQQLVYCERERESVSFVILADQSESMTKKIPFVQEAALSLVDPGLPKDPFRDEYSVFGIESRAKRLVPFTRDQHDLERRLPLLLTPTKGRTALFDGIYLGVASAQSEAENKRRAVIIISDGGDNNSRYNLRETQRLLEEADMPVFAVMRHRRSICRTFSPCRRINPNHLLGRDRNQNRSFLVLPFSVPGMTTSVLMNVAGLIT
jgi:Ca-activated chloride channel family protein